MKPTDEQQAAIDLFNLRDGNLAIEAGAGTGKTSTLLMLAKAAPNERGQYIAFNRALVVDATAKFPPHVRAQTAHSLAFRAVGHLFKARLDSAQRMRGYEIAARLGIDPVVIPDFSGQPQKLAAGFLATRVARAVTRFCQSADTHIQTRHFEKIDGIDRPDEPPLKQAELFEELLPYAVAMWADLNKPNGWVPFKHEHYLKMWQLRDPQIPADYVLFDEAQDANPVIAAIVAAQKHAQLVYVGDSQQEIYGWTGAINALANVAVAHRTFLSQSFRFGEAIATAANGPLQRLHAQLRLRGNPDIASRVIPVAQPRAVLCRTNAGVLTRVLREQADGRRAAIVGGGAEVASFAEAARQLMTSGSTSHPDLSCFGNWGDVVAYVTMDEEGSDLKLMVNLVESFGVDAIKTAVAQQEPEASADVVVSTAHKAKGREWDTVQIANDFMNADEADPASLRLEYVAITRAKYDLDMDALKPKPAPEAV